MNPQVNDAIFDLMERKLVTSATLIANAPFVEEASQRIRAFPNCSFGVHLNVTEFHPLSPHGDLAPLLDDQGMFVKDRIREVSMNSNLAQGIFQEYCYQIEKLGSLGVTISHLDSHHYVHTLPKVFPILKKVQKRFKIRKVRISRNIFSSGESVPISLRAKKALFNFMLRHYVRSKTTQGFSNFKLFYERGRTQDIKHRTFEAMVHPGNPYYDADETELLQGPWRDDLAFPVRLISYNELD